MLDFLADAIALVLDVFASPDTISRQRLARLVSAGLAGAIVAAVHTVNPTGGPWTLLVVAAAFAAAWAAAFSVIDVLNEGISVAWLSGAVVALGGTVAVAGFALVVARAA